MANQEVIRRLRIIAQTEGMDKAASMLQTLEENAGDLTRGFAMLSAQTDTATGNITSLGQRVENIARKVIPARTEMARFQRDMELLNRYAAQNAGNQGVVEYVNRIRQGLIDASSAQREFNAESQRLKSITAQGLQFAMPREEAIRRITAEVEDYDEALRRQLITQKQHEALVANSSARLAQYQNQLTGTTGKIGMVNAGLVNFSYQMQDIVSGLAMGQSPFTIMAQQGAQLYDAVMQAGGNTSLVAGFSRIGIMIRGLISPISIMGATLVATAAAATYGWYKFHTTIKDLRSSLEGLGRLTGLSTNDANNIAQQAAQRTGTSPWAAREDVATLNRAGRVDPNQYSEMISRSYDMARVTGGTQADALKELADAMADPAKGAETLNEKFLILNQTQLRHIQTMAEAGDKTGAQKAIMDALSGSIDHQAERLGLFTRAWAGFTHDLDEFGKLFERSAEVPAERIAQMLKQLEDARATLGMFTPEQRVGAAAVAGTVAARQNELENYQENQRFAGRLSMLGRESAAVADVGIEIAKMVTGLEDLGKEAETLDGEIKRLQAVSDDPKTDDVTRERARRGLIDRRWQLGSVERAMGAGSREMLQIQDANKLAAATAVMGDYERAQAEINNRYKELTENNRKLAGQEAQLNAERLKALDTLDKSRAFAAATGLIPEFEQRRDAQRNIRTMEGAGAGGMNMNPDEFTAALSRMRVQLETMRTPLEDFIHSWRLENDLLQARTGAERAAAEAQKAYSDELDRGHDALLASLAAEQARNRALTEATKAAEDAVRGALNQSKLIGLRPLQQQEEQIRQRYDEMRRGAAGIGNIPLAGLGTAGVSAGSGQLATIVNEVRRQSAATGISPLYMLAAMSYETGGTFSTSITNASGHTGLIQFGRAEQSQYGVTTDPTNQVQAAYRFMQDRGYKPGMSLDDFYSTINAGSPGRGYASDAGAGGAPGTVSQKVANQFGPHLARAQALLGGVPGQGQTPEEIAKGAAARDKEAAAEQRRGDALRSTGEALEISNARTAAAVQFMMSHTDAIDAQNRLLDAQINSFGMSQAAQDKATASAQLWNEAIQQGIDKLPGMSALIEQLAQKQADLAEKQRQVAAATQLAQDINGAFSGAISGFVHDLIQGKSAAEAFKNALASLAEKMMDSVLKWALNGLLGGTGGPGGGLVGMLLGGLGGGGGGGGVAPDGFLAPLPTALFHQGGLVGKGGTLRLDNPMLYLNAPRMHSGFGLMAGERRAIMQDGEGVLSRRDMAALRSSAANSNAPVVMPTNIQIITPPGTTASASESRNVQGGKDIKVLIQEAAAEGMSRPGNPANRVLRQQTGAGAPLTRR